MRIAIDARYVCDYFPGIGRYVYNLLRALSCLTSTDSLLAFYDSGRKNSRYNLSLLTSPKVELIEAKAQPISLKEQWHIPFLLKGIRVEVFHTPYYIRPYLTPCPSLVTIHDTISCHHPEYLPSAKARWVFWMTMRLAIRSSKVVITDSMASKEDLIRFFGVAAGKIRVIPLAADEFLTPIGKELEESNSPYILYVGINKPHKNLARLIQAFAKTNLNHQLVIAGSWDHRYPEPRRLVEELALRDRVKFLGPVSEKELRLLYYQASLFVFPSLAEGFGLPVLEAMACGLPVIVSHIQPLADLVGEGGILINPFDTEELADAIQRVATNRHLSQELSQGAQLRARDFSWQKTAELTLAAYREAALR